MKGTTRDVHPLSLFIHVPRTGGTSVTNWIREATGGNFRQILRIDQAKRRDISGQHVSFGHIPLSRVQACLPELVVNSDTFVYTVIRDPWTRFWSVRRWLLRNNLVGRKDPKWLLEEASHLPLRDSPYNVVGVSQILPQTHWLLDQPLSDIHVIGRLENLEPFVEALQARFDIAVPLNRRDGRTETEGDAELIEAAMADSEFVDMYFDFYQSDYEHLSYVPTIH